MDYLYMKLFTKDLQKSECFVRDILEAKIVKSGDMFFESDFFGYKVVFQLITDHDKSYRGSPIVLSERHQVETIYQRCLTHGVKIIQKPIRLASNNQLSLIIEDNLGCKIDFRCYELGNIFADSL